MDKIQLMKEKIKLLNEAAKAYYQENREIMSNYEYDRLYDELAELEERNCAFQQPYHSGDMNS